MQRNNNKSKKGGKNRKMIPRNPPSLEGVLRVGIVFRYTKTNASDALVYTNCMGKLLCAATAATTGFCIYESIKLRKIIVRGIGVTSTNAGGFLTNNNTVAVRVDDGAVAPFGQERLVKDIPTSTQSPMVVCKFTGLMSSWIDADNCVSITGQRLMVVTGPIGTVVDLKATLQIIVSKTSSFTSLTGAGLTSRLVYFNYLDNTASAGAPTAGTQYLQNINGSNSTSFV